MKKYFWFFIFFVSGITSNVGFWPFLAELGNCPSSIGYFYYSKHLNWAAQNLQLGYVQPAGWTQLL